VHLLDTHFDFDLSSIFRSKFSSLAQRHEDVFFLFQVLPFELCHLLSICFEFCVLKSSIDSVCVVFKIDLFDNLSFFHLTV
jgi:hypothetical protein